MNDWKRTLTFVWLSQFFSIAGFSFGMPFAAYYLQDLGVTTRLEWWVALFSASTPLTLAVFAPIWGHMSDRFGRRLMMMRAYAGGAVVLCLMSLVRGPWELIALRLLQGVFTGTVTAAQIMVASTAPRERGGSALGVLSTSLYSGGMVGAAAGGMVAEAFGYRMSFLCASLCLILSLVLTVFGTRETRSADEFPASPAVGAATTVAPRPPWFAAAGAPVLALIFFAAAIRQFDAPFVPLLVQELNGGRLEGAAFLSGILAALGAVAGMAAGFSLGRLADRMSPCALARVCAAIAALAVLPQAVVRTFAPLAGARFGLALFAGGLDPVFHVWLMRTTSERQRGLFFGWAATAKAGGWVLAPLVGGALAARYGVRAVFVVEAILFAFLAVAISRAGRRSGATVAVGGG